tara:strand:+ start:468 stop:1391 length:924 start_codon:yes stop_codon:yes gene_type:complete
METILPSYRDEYIKNIITEQIIFESFLSTVKDFAKDKLGKAVNTIKDWKDAAAVFSQVLSSKKLLGDFLKPLERLVQKQLQKLYGILKKVKLDSVVKKIEEFFKKITSLDGWKKLFALIAIGGIALYAANKLPIDGIQLWITKTLGTDFIQTITSKLIDWKSYIGYLGPIVGGGAIIFKLLEPLLTKFKEALKSTSSFATKLIKENKRIMKKSQFKNIIKEQLLNILKEEEKKQTVIPSQLKKLISDLDPNIDMQILSMALAKIAQGKEISLSLKENKLLTQVFIALMKNKDVALGQKFLAVFKQIK